MKRKFISIVFTILTSVSINAQNIADPFPYIGGLNFVDTQVSVTSDIAFDNGPEAANFTLNIQSGLADDRQSVIFAGISSLSEKGWAAFSDIYETELSGNLPSQVEAGQIGTTNVRIVNGGTSFPVSASLFGGTSAVAEGFDNDAGISFGQNTGGLFTIDLLQGVNNAFIAFDVTALASQSQTGGLFLTVNNQIVDARNPGNVKFDLGNLASGESIVFQFQGANNGLTFDNFQIAGTVVPEPSTYAAITGILVFGLVIYHRRRR